MNRFKPIKKLIQFVYPDEFHFHRVPADNWEDIENIKTRFEEMLRRNNISLTDIFETMTDELLIKWDLSNPLKRHHDSPYQLINTIYPDTFKPFQFRKNPHGYAKIKNARRTIFNDA